MLSISIIIISIKAEAGVQMTNIIHNPMAPRNYFINEVINNYISNISLARSANTARTYKNAMQLFSYVLETNGVDPSETPINEIDEISISWMASALKEYSPATERLYLTATAGLFDYIISENLAQPNLSRIRRLIQLRSRRYGQRLPQFPREDIEKVIVYAQSLSSFHVDNNQDLLRNLRDRAFLLLLADTGLRVHEACNLQRGDIDWNEGKAIIIGKGNQQSVIRFSRRSINALREYVNSRSKLDGASGRPLSALPLFSRHDRGAGKKVLPITTTTGRNIVSQRVSESLGEKANGMITPHSFRHYFVTTVLRGSGGNLKLAQELARHKSISVTQRYAHLSDEELDQSYWEIFDQK